MTLQVPADLVAALHGFVAGGRYKDEAEVLREALDALQEREDDLAAIQEGIDDEAAGRLHPWSEVKGELRAKYGMAD